MKFKEQLKIAYEQSTCAFDFEEVMSIFEYYYRTYQKHTGKEHPRLKTKTLVSIIDDMGGDDMFSPLDYPVMITTYFETYFHNCDYSICHFFSGKIRELRFYESVL